MNIIGDIAGNYKTLLALIAKMPSGEVISVGDMIDRGHSSREVLKWFMSNGKAVMGNHEHMMLDHINNGDYYDFNLWIRHNGGSITLNQFVLADELIEVVNWLNNLPLYIETSDLFISHAPKHPVLSLEKCCDLGKGFVRYNYDRHSEDTLLWNRGTPRALKSKKFQVFGHNAFMGLKWFEDYGVCLDTSRCNILTGLHWPSKEIFQQEYID